MSGRRNHAHGGAGNALGTLVVLALVLSPVGSTADTDDVAWSPPALSGTAGDLPEGRQVGDHAERSRADGLRD